MLTLKQVKAIEPKDKDFKLYDEKGLFLLVKKNGSKYWRFKYRFNKKEKLASYGTFPEVSISEARNRRDTDRSLLREGTDPSEKRKSAAIASQDRNAFKTIAEEWLIQRGPKSETGDYRLKNILEKDLIPEIGHLDISTISAPILLDAIKKIQNRGAVETGRRANQFAGQIFRFGIATDRCESDPSQNIRDALKTNQTKHFSAITDPKKFGQLLRTIDSYIGSPAVMAGLKLSPLLFCRPTELRHLVHSEINWDKQRIEIPAAKMKTGSDHIIPLASQSVEILENYLSLGLVRGDYVFPSARGQSRPLSENALRSALRSMGFDNDTQTTHGFRASARTMLDEELEFPVDWIEHQLAHSVRDVNGRAYNRTKHLKQRTGMMQAWADYLDKLKANNI